MFLSTFTFFLANVCVKQIVHIPAMEIVFFRCLLASTFCFVGLRHARADWRGTNHKLLLLRGIFDLVVAIVAHGAPLWWVGLVTGSAQILLAFWAAGNFGHKAFLIVVWVGATALAQGVVQIVRAFQLKPG